MQAVEQVHPSPDHLIEQDLCGRHFYRPGVIATYCVLGGLPIGMFLYGLNVGRRGERFMGYALIAVSVLLLLVLAAGPVLAGPVQPNLRNSLGFLGIFCGVGLLNMETGPYRRALLRGGATARWWPPLLCYLAYILLVVGFSIFHAYHAKL